jgi:hypothetical protein
MTYKVCISNSKPGGLLYKLKKFIVSDTIFIGKRAKIIILLR